MRFSTARQHILAWAEPVYEAVVLFTLAVLFSEFVRPGLFSSLLLPVLLLAVALGTIGLMFQHPSRLSSSGLVFLLLIGILWVASTTFITAALVMTTSALAWYMTNHSQSYD